MSEERCVRPKDLAAMAGVRPQMVYNYISAGRIPAVRCSDHNDTLCVDISDAWDWLDARQAKADKKYEEIQRQLRGEV